MLEYLARGRIQHLRPHQERRVSFMGVINVNTKACTFEIFKDTWKPGTTLSRRKQKVRRTKERKIRGTKDRVTGDMRTRDGGL